MNKVIVGCLLVIIVLLALPEARTIYYKYQGKQAALAKCIVDDTKRRDIMIKNYKFLKEHDKTIWMEPRTPQTDEEIVASCEYWQDKD